MQKVKLGLLLLTVTLVFTGCGLSKTDVLEKLVSKEEGKYTMQIFSTSRDWDFKVNGVHNSEQALLMYIQEVTIHSENNKLEWLKVLGLEENRPIILIFDTEKMVFHTNNPEELREFAKNLDAKTKSEAENGPSIKVEDNRSDKKDPSKDNAQYHINFPEVVKLAYEKVEFESLDDNVSIMNWERQKSIPFGEISGESIFIDLYSNKDESSNFIGLLHFNNQSYLIRPIGYSHDIESIETYIINTKYTDVEKGLHLIGAIGSPALGYQYVFYDDTNKEWLVYHNWGIPTVIDVNGDGNDELLLQFQGMGNNFTNISVLSRNNENRFQVTTINDYFIDLMEIDTSLNRISSTLNSDGATLEVELIGEEHESKKYKFDTLETLLIVN